jgi:hypothetical protein
MKNWLTVQLYTSSVGLTQMFESVTNRPMSASDLHSAVGNMSTLPCWRALFGAVTSEMLNFGKDSSSHVASLNRRRITRPYLVDDITSRSPSQQNGTFVGVLVRVGACRWQTNRWNTPGNDDGRVQCQDGDIVGLIQICKLWMSRIEIDRKSDRLT